MDVYIKDVHCGLFFADIGLLWPKLPKISKLPESIVFTRK